MGTFSFNDESRYRCSGGAKDLWNVETELFQSKSVVDISGNKLLKDSHTYVYTFAKHSRKFSEDNMGTIDFPATAPALRFEL